MTIKTRGSHCMNNLVILAYEVITNELAMTYEDKPSIRPKILRKKVTANV